MSVTVDVDAERGALFHSCRESFVYTVPMILAAPSNTLPTMLFRSRLSSVIEDFTNSYSTSLSVDFVE